MPSRSVVVTTAVLVAAVCLGCAATTARAEAQTAAPGPSFDCSKANSEVEKLICADRGLADLDHKLAGVYEAALRKAKDDVPSWLRTQQRGWVKGRNECWKAKDADNPVYLTESWIATDVRSCVEGEYRLRIAELQVRFQLVPGKKPAFYSCNGEPANQVVATFFETDPPAASFERGDRTVVGFQVKTTSVVRYEGQNLWFVNDDTGATATWLGEELKCTLQ